MGLSTTLLTHRKNNKPLTPATEEISFFFFATSSATVLCLVLYAPNKKSSQKWPQFHLALTNLQEQLPKWSSPQIYVTPLQKKISNTKMDIIVGIIHNEFPKSLMVRSSFWLLRQKKEETIAKHFHHRNKIPTKPESHRDIMKIINLKVDRI